MESAGGHHASPDVLLEEKKKYFKIIEKSIWLQLALKDFWTSFIKKQTN